MYILGNEIRNSDLSVIWSQLKYPRGIAKTKELDLAFQNCMLEASLHLTADFTFCIHNLSHTIETGIWKAHAIKLHWVIVGEWDKLHNFSTLNPNFSVPSERKSRYSAFLNINYNNICIARNNQAFFGSRENNISDPWHLEESFYFIIIF